MPAWLRPPNANYPRPWPAAIPPAITGIVAVDELPGFFFLTMPPVVIECSNRYCDRKSKCEDSHKQQTSRP
jgi:hypothetical protein